MKKTLLFICCFILAQASFAQCLSEKENLDVQKRYEVVIKDLEELRKDGRESNEGEFDKLNKESLKLERVIEFQEDQCL